MTNHGYYVYLVGNGPLSGLPLCWFAYIADAEEFVNNHGSPTYKLEILPANDRPL